MPFGAADLVGGNAGLLTGVAARGWFIAPLLGLGGGVWASCRYWGPPCLRFIQAALSSARLQAAWGTAGGVDFNVCQCFLEFLAVVHVTFEARRA